MGARPLCVAPHDTLRQRARPVTEFAADLRRLVQDMIETMYAHEGIGLAAPQIGRDVQLFVANPTRQRGREVVVVNPTLTAARGRSRMVEGCLSVPEVWERVTRASRVPLEGQNLSGKPLAIDAEGLLAIVLQHEVDHLQGRLFLDRLSWIRRLGVGFKRRRTAA